MNIIKSNPVEVAEYAATKILLNKPSFIWWAPHVLQKRTRIVAAVNKRYHKQTTKFGIEVPNSWDDCVKLDKENDNTLWKDTLRKEMKNLRIAFKILNGEESVPPNLPRDSLSYDIRCQDGWVHRSGVVQNGSGDLLYCETLLGREWRCFIFCRILSLGAIDGRDKPGWGVLRMLGGVMLKFTEHV
jgi:hypothetical protein